MKKLSSSIAGLALCLLSASAAAQTYGVVKVDCDGRCDRVNLGQVCDTFTQNATPVAVACDDTSIGAGFDANCGGVNCRPYGVVIREDLLSAYCDDGAGFDATVSCVVAGPTKPKPAIEKRDDGKGRQ